MTTLKVVQTSPIGTEASCYASGARLGWPGKDLCCDLQGRHLRLQEILIILVQRHDEPHRPSVRGLFVDLGSGGLHAPRQQRDAEGNELEQKWGWNATPCRVVWGW